MHQECVIAQASSRLPGHLTCWLCAGTAGLNVPMFIALRRFTLLCTIVLERFMMGKKHDRFTIGAVGVMIGGEYRQYSATYVQTISWRRCLQCLYLFEL